MFARVIEYLQAGATKGLKSSGHSLSNQAYFGQPLLGKTRALAATPAHDHGIGVGLAEGLPSRHALVLDLAADQLMT